MPKKDQNQQKPNNFTTIEIDLESYGLLRKAQADLQTILRKKKVSYSQVIRVLYNVSHLQQELTDMILEKW